MIRGSLAGHAGVPMRRAPSLIKLYVNFILGGGRFK